MGGWGTYVQRMQNSGLTRREKNVQRTRDTITRKIMANPASHMVTIDGNEQLVTIIHKQDLSQKRICALPGETLKHGGIVEFADNRWMITELDADNEVYHRGLMERCNYQLRWLNAEGRIIEKWCIVEDGTKYLIGEKVNQFLTVGDARIAVTIAKDEDTIYLNRGMRFLIDDVDTGHPLAYQITKPNRLFNSYNGEGVFRFILTEVNLTDADNVELRIADYANWKPQKALDSDHVDIDRRIEDIVEDAIEYDAIPENPNKEVWL